MISEMFSKVALRGIQGGAVCIVFSMLCSAQVQTTKTETQGKPTKEVTIQRGEIVYLSGRTVILKMDDGSLREFDNVPDSVTFMVDGKPVNINNAQVGMKLEKQTVRTATPKTVITVEAVTGKVWHVIPPKTVILTLENGQNQKFTIPDGQKFMVDGRETDAWGLRKGMKITAQRVTQAPEVQVAEQVQRTGSAPQPPAVPTAGVPVLIVVAVPTPPPLETAETTPTTLPKTGSSVPLVGFLGLLLCGSAVGLAGVRMIATNRRGSNA